MIYEEKSFIDKEKQKKYENLVDKLETFTIVESREKSKVNNLRNFFPSHLIMNEEGRKRQTII